MVRTLKGFHTIRRSIVKPLQGNNCYSWQTQGALGDLGLWNATLVWVVGPMEMAIGTLEHPPTK